MSKQARRRQARPSPCGPATGAAAPSFTPVPVRQRHDGWTAQRQAAFLRALGECGCVEEAARLVGMSARSAYTLKARPDARSFREAWDAVLDYAMGRIGDALIGRALNGEATPVFYKGEQIGERRRYDNRLAMWLLRLRQPDRWGRGRERFNGYQDSDEAAVAMDLAIGEVTEIAAADDAGLPRPDYASERREVVTYVPEAEAVAPEPMPEPMAEEPDPEPTPEERADEQAATTPDLLFDVAPWSRPYAFRDAPRTS